MLNEFSRTQLMFGDAAMKKLAASRVAVFGIGGVGGYAVEALVRSGIGAIDLIDNDTVSLTNINRQIYALHSTIGRYKVDVAKGRIADINPDCVVKTYKTFFMPERESEFNFSEYDYVIDAIDTITAKLSIVCCAKACGTPIISSMAAGNKLDPTAFKVADIYKTCVCPVARVMRRELKKMGIQNLKVVYSEEKPTPYARFNGDEEEELAAESGRRAVPASNAFVPSAAGLLIAGEVIKDLIAPQSLG